MNVVEKQTELGRSIFQINTQAMTESAELARKSVERYLETNRNFAERLPEVRDISAFMELQREYGETLLTGARETLESQGAIFQSVLNGTQEALRAVFAPEAKEEAKGTKRSTKSASAKASEASQEAA